MIKDSIFSFKKHEEESGDYVLYLFTDFSGDLTSNNLDISHVLAEVRQEIYSPSTIFIICIDSDLDESKHRSRFSKEQEIKYIKYEDISDDIFKIGIRQIVEDNKVVQYAPHGTVFKKTSSKESHYFIKASLSLSEYPQICFLALSLYQEIKDKIPSIKKFYVDTSSIIPLIQALICYQNIVDSGDKFHPKILNFKSYTANHFIFNSDSYTIISASSSGGLQDKIGVDTDKCITIFLLKAVSKEYKCLFQIDIKGNQSLIQPLMPIPLTTEDFSLAYSKSEEVIITKKYIDKLDEKKLIKKLLDENFKNVEYSFPHNEIYNQDLLEFDETFLKEILENFTSNIFNRCLLSKKDNCIIYRGEIPENINKIKIDTFLEDNSDVGDKNIIVFLDQSNEKELIQISRKLRKHSVFNITYIIGILLTKDIAQSKTLQNNICFNDTDHKYGFYCYLDLPLLTINKPDIKRGVLSDGFIFYEDKDGKSSELEKKQVYLVVCLILELLRHDNKLSDNISFYHVISPKNFSRFNDSLLQLSILSAAKGRELDFSSNKDLSHEMKNVIIDLMKEDIRAGKIFIKHIENKNIFLIEGDYLQIKTDYLELFTEKSI
ncbi:hypothetical protein [uncultured Gammaproteobacteria bacterium]|nr:hypothetical protein [uncultured Gammaproteobacteria bacterium]